MVFDSFLKKRKSALYLGSPEAEAESLPTSKVSLKDVYEDHHDLFTELSNEKFIIVGRKGCGKSAFAEYATSLASSDANLFCTFIRQDTISLEELVHLGAGVDTDKAKEHLFKWLIYTNILKLFFKNEAAQQAPKYSLLIEFLKRNSGYIDIDKGEVTELVRKHKFEISIEYFKRFFKGKYNEDLEIKESRASYFKLLPHLERVLVDVLTSRENIDNRNSYVIFFDDLDIGFKSSNAESINTLISLIRTSKHINNNVFSKNNALAKVVILIRDDIERLISPLGADIAKIFSSYSTSIDWYQDEYLQSNLEDKLGLKKMMNKRIKHAFEQASLKMSKESPWDSLVENDFHPKTSFKYIADHTFLNPRDFILLFKPLETGRYDIPLNKFSVNGLIGQYASEIIKELSNELSSFYSSENIQSIFDALKKISFTYDCSYEKANKIFQEECSDLDSENILLYLFNRSIIGTVNSKNGFVKFKHKITKKDAHNYDLEKDQCIIIHSGIKIYMQNRKAV